MSIRIVLDTSALLGYLAGDTRALNIGELIAIAAEDGNTVAAPALCVLSTYNLVSSDRQAAIAQRMALLDFVGDSGDALLIPLLGDDVPPVAELTESLPRGEHQAHAAHVAITYGALLATYHPEDYAHELPAEDILDL